VKLARRNVPAIALVTEEFTEQGNFVARSVGMPNIPRLELPHPLAGSGEKNLSRVARQTAPRIIELLRGTA
jgi:hypothetical protein